MTTLFPLSRVLAAALAASALAATGASATTLGERLASGSMSFAAFQQLISGAGVSDVEARGMTVSDIALIKWKDND